MFAMNKNYKKEYEDLKKEYEKFAYIIAHDLQSPARQLSSFTHILLDELKEYINEQQQPYVEIIEYSSHEINSKLSSLLELALLNDTEVSLQKLSLNDLLNEVLEAISHESSVRFANLEFSSLGHVYADYELLSKAFAQIFLELYKLFIESNSIEIQIKEHDETFKSLLFICHDVALTNKQLESMFDPFFDLGTRLHSQDHQIGLALCKKMFEVNNGQLNILSFDKKLIIEVMLLKSKHTVS